MMRIVYGILVILVLLVGLVFAAPMIIPPETIKSQVATLIEERTGRKLEIAGAVKPSLFPSIGVELGDVSFANAPWASEPTMVSAKELVAELEILPLLSGDYKITGFRVVEPVVHIEVDENGRTNLEFEAASLPRPYQVAAADEAAVPAPPAGDPFAMLRTLSIHSVEIVDGRVTYADRRDGTAHDLDDVTLNLALPGFAETMTADGTMTLNGEAVGIDARVDSLASLLENRETVLDVTIDSDVAMAAYDGRFTAPDPAADMPTPLPVLAGEMQLSVPDVGSPALADLLRFAGVRLPDAASRLSAIDLSGTVDLSETTLTTNLNGMATYAGKPVTLAVLADGDGGFMDGQPASLTVSLESEALSTAFEGAIAGGAVPTAKGRYEVASKAPDEVVKWLDIGPPLRALGPVEIEGDIDVGIDAYTATAKGAVTYKDEPVELDVSARGVGRPEDAGPLGLVASARSSRFDSKFDGSLTPGELAANGAVRFQTASLRDMAAWAGVPLETVGGLGPVSLNSTLAAQGKAIDLKGFVLEIDESTATGDFRVEVGVAPRFVGDLKIDQIDTGTYLAALPPDAQSKPQPSGGGTAGGDTGDATQTSQGGGTAPPPARSGGWSTEPIDMSALHAFSSELVFDVGRLKHEAYELSDVDLKVVVWNGKTHIESKRFTLFEGQGRGRVEITDNGPAPTFMQAVVVEGVALRPLLRAAAGLNSLEGTGTLKVRATSAGGNLDTVMRGLAGEGNILLRDGAVYGLNPAAFVRQAGSLFLDQAAAQTQKTDFAEISGTFTIDGGVLSNQDLAFVGPLVRAKGAGTVDIGNQSLNYTVTPSAVASLQGQGAANGIAGLPLFPVRITGPWANPQFAVDPSKAIENVLKDPEAALKAGESLLKGDGAKDLLRNVIGGASGGAAAGSGDTATAGSGATATKPENPEAAVEGLVRGLLGGNKPDEEGGRTAGGSGGGTEDPAQKLIRGLFGN